ncbi:MAG: GTP cyclohydrolase I FolE2 [Vampirovibrio sp.]|nr:GTP cyclohydrolase I FolE2 [Vampirovibrio sp.]
MKNAGSQNANPLLDVQNLQDHREIDLQRVGVSRVMVPMNVVQKNGNLQPVTAKATMSVGLGKAYKGTHMSRFISQLTEWSKDKHLSLDLQDFLAEAKERLKAPSAQIQLDFQYFIDKKAPVTGISAPMAYACRFDASLGATATDYDFMLGVTAPISTLCPCSKAISDYGAHNQRAEIRAEVLIDTQTPHPMIWIEDLVEALDTCASCPVFPFLKREDEKWVTERQYDNPKFVEDVMRDAIALLREFPGVKSFNLEVEALESIHGHNAWCAHQEENGARQENFVR